MSTDDEWLSNNDEVTGELDTAALGVMLQQQVERTFGDPPTVRLERNRLLDLLEESSGLKPVAHTVPRESVPHESQVNNTAKFFASPIDESLDTDISPSLAPLVIIGVIVMLLGLFFAIMHAG